MIAGVIYLALGLKKVAEYVGDTEHHSLSDPLTGTGLWSLYGGGALLLFGHLAFRLRNLGTVNTPPAVDPGLPLITPLGVLYLPALAALAVLAGILVVMLAYEVVHFAEARARVRAELAHE